MKVFRLFFVSWIFISTSGLMAQDIHYSLFNMSPLSLNPAHTGAFEGTARVGGIYRDQWASIISNQFQTPSFYVDAPIIRAFGNDWIGAGVMIYNDKAGSLELGTSAFLFSVAYHHSLSKRNTDHVLTLGVQGGQVARSLKTRELLLGSGIDATGPIITQTFGPANDPGFGSGDGSGDLESTFFDINAGIMLRSVLNDYTNLETGISATHITQGKYGLLGGGSTGSAGSPVKGGDAKRPMLMTFHGRVRYQMNDDWNITPGVLFRSTAGTKPEIALQSWLGRKINDDFTLNFGAAYRFADAGEILAGLDYLDEFRVALAYDVNLSSLASVSRNQGGFELAAYYIFKLYKKPKANPAILCPKF